MRMNLKTTIAAYPKLSESILKNYATIDDLGKTEERFNQSVTDMKQEIAETYVPEVEDRDSTKIYGRNGRDRSWVELKSTAVASEADLWFGYNGDMQMDIYQDESGNIINNVTSLQYHDLISKDTEYYDLKCEIPKGDYGYLWICCTRPIKAIQWMGYLWGAYSKQKDLAVDPITGKSYFCYHSDEMLISNHEDGSSDPEVKPWEFKLIF